MSVSVIIPTYNRLALLTVTLENIFKQTVLPKEVIVVDNGSTDGTVTFLKENYKDRIILLHSGKNSPGAARNLGFEASTGKYIQFMDSDDVVTRNKFSAQLKVLRKTGAGGVYCPYVHAFWDEQQSKWIQKDVILQYKALPYKLDIHKCMVRGFFTIIPGFLFDRDFLKETGPWREDIVAYEDWDFLWRMGEVCPYPPHTSECCYFYRVHGLQTTGNDFNNKERDRQKLIVFTDLWNNFVRENKKLTTLEKNFFKAQLYRTIAQDDNRNFDPELTRDLSGIEVRIADTYLRVESKINRIISGTNWQIMHRVNKDPDLFKKYLSLL